MTVRRMAASQEADRPNSFGWPSHPNILVVDDESLSRCIVSALLKKCNYKGELSQCTEDLDMTRRSPCQLRVIKRGFDMLVP